jgi:hypothetical protein
MPQKTWYCVVRSGDYQLLYAGTDKSAADAKTNDRTFLGQGENLGQAQRAAALGAGKLTQHLGNARGIGRY